MNLKTYGLQLKEIRESKQLSQKRLAELSKVTQCKISKIENGADCQVSTFLKLCKAMNHKVDIREFKK